MSAQVQVSPQSNEISPDPNSGTIEVTPRRPVPLNIFPRFLVVLHIDASRTGRMNRVFIAGFEASVKGDGQNQALSRPNLR